MNQENCLSAKILPTPISSARAGILSVQHRFTMRIQWILALAALPLASCGQEQEQPAASDVVTDAGSTGSAAQAPAAIEMADKSAQPAKLAQCKVCHTFDEDGPDQLGPNLWGVYGQAAASDADFAYSTALRNAGLVWDDGSLDAYLADPRTTVPGGKMSFAGFRNVEDRKAVIEYMATLTPDAGSE